MIIRLKNLFKKKVNFITERIDPGRFEQRNKRNRISFKAKKHNEHFGENSCSK